MLENRSKTGFAAAILGTAYTLYLLFYFGSSSDTAGAIAFALVMPHFICNLIASIFAWLGFRNNSRGMMIAALVLFVVAIFLFIIYFLFDLPMVILSSIAIVKIGKLNNA